MPHACIAVGGETGKTHICEDANSEMAYCNKPASQIVQTPVKTASPTDYGKTHKKCHNVCLVKHKEVPPGG
jgi:hypothetical protein